MQPAAAARHVDVLVCGAGASGLTLAVDLARRNIRFNLIEKALKPFEGSRGKGIQPRTQEIFEDLGLLDPLVAAGRLYPTQRCYGEDNVTFTDSVAIDLGPATVSEPFHIPLLVPQFLTEALLRDRLAELGHKTFYGCELTAIIQDAEGVTATCQTASGEQTIHAKYLIGCDGGKSFVRHALKIEFPGKTLGVRAMVADVHLEGFSQDFWHRFNEGKMDKQLSVCPLLRNQDLFQLQAPIPLEGDFDLSLAGLTSVVATRTGRSDFKILSVAWASAYNMNARLAERYRVGRAFLVGDSAHIHPPTGGQGLNTSVQDAYNLSWKLSAILLNSAPDSLLDTYEEERRPIAAQMLGMATRLLNEVRSGKMTRQREVTQLDLSYNGGALALEAPARTEGLRAGDRAPDAPVKGAAHQHTRLFNLFSGPHWTLLCYDVAAPREVKGRVGLRIHVIGPTGDIRDEDLHFRQYGVSPGTLVLVRPDGYVGAIVSQVHVPDLVAYMEKMKCCIRS